MGRKSKYAASTYLDLNRRVDSVEAAQRLAERDARMAADSRTEVEKYLGDPPPARSALAQVRNPMHGQAPRSAGGMRVDLWKR